MVLSLGEILEELSDSEIQQAIMKRHELINQMVGTLYPSILMSEIVKLRNQKEKV